MRLTGMDIKLEQYRKGEAFVAAIADAAGGPALRPAVGRAGDAAAPRRDRRSIGLARPGHAGGRLVTEADGR